MDKQGLATYKTYGGSEAVDQFLANFAPSNPALAALTVEFVYGRLISNDMINNQDKAALVLAGLGALGGLPAAASFHSQAFIRNGGTADAGQEILAFGELVASNPDEAEKKLDLLPINADVSVLCAISAAGVLGVKRTALLNRAFEKAVELGIEQQKILYTINLIACYAGFPAAITASAAYQKFIAIKEAA